MGARLVEEERKKQEAMRLKETAENEVQKEKLAAEARATRRIQESKQLCDLLQSASSLTDDLDQYAKVQDGLKATKTAITNGLVPTPELQAKIIELQKLEKRLEKVGELRKLVLKLNSKTLAEIRSFGTPHQFVMSAMQATFFLLGSNLNEIDTWAEIRIKMGKTGRESLKRKTAQ